MRSRPTTNLIICLSRRESVINIIICYRYEKDYQLKSEMLFLEAIRDHATADATFEAFDSFYRKYKLSYEDLNDFTSDGCHVMLGAKNSVAVKGSYHLLLFKYDFCEIGDYFLNILFSKS